MRMHISITGVGAVSPAGWGVPAMMAALDSRVELERSLMEREVAGHSVQTEILRVPTVGATTPKFPRLRRTSPISKFAAAATLEALGEERLAKISEGLLRVGVIFSLSNGCVNYSNRFFTEALADPSLASPILFPETVFNAPASHLSAMIGSHAPNDTLIADSTGIFTGIDLAIEWLERGEVDGCLVVSAEEIDWLSAEGLRYYSRDFLPSEGAAALYLESGTGHAQILQLPEAVTFANRSRAEAAIEMRTRLATHEEETLLIDGRAGVSRVDAPETHAWADWNGQCWSPRHVLGEGMGVSSAWQIVAGVEALRRDNFRKVIVSAVGGNQQAAGMILGR